MKLSLLCISLCLFTLTASGQRIGYADWQNIFIQLPEFKKMDDQLKAEGTQLEKAFNAKTQELELKKTEYEKNGSTMLPAVRRNADMEIDQLTQNLEKFRQDAMTTLQSKQKSLMDPIYTKVGKAIEEVAKENDYDLIVTPQVGEAGDVVLYANEKYNITDLVLKKLGVTPKPITAPTK